MKVHLIVPSVALLSWGIVPVAIAESNSPEKTDINPIETSDSDRTVSSVLNTTTEASPPQQPITNIPRLSEIERPHTSAKLLVQKPTPSAPTLSQTNQPADEAEPSASEEEEEIEITVTGERDTLQKSDVESPRLLSVG